MTQARHKSDDGLKVSSGIARTESNANVQCRRDAYNFPKPILMKDQS